MHTTVQQETDRSSEEPTEEVGYIIYSKFG